jgi:hypothetical protein
VLANGKQFLSEDKHDKFNVYIDEELNFDNKINSHSMVICLSCYTPFILYSKSDKYEFLIECFEHFETIAPKTVDISSVDIFCFRLVFEKIVEIIFFYYILSYTPVCIIALL